jgi:thioredoxin 1
MPQLLESQEQLDILLKENKLVILKFFTDWCPPCKVVAPIYEDLSKRFPDIKFLECNSEKTALDPQVMIWGVPSFVLFQNGEAVEKITGADLNRLETILMEYQEGKQSADGWITYYWRRYGF